MRTDFNNEPGLYATNAEEYFQILADSEKMDRMTKEQLDYEYSEHVIFQNEELCVFRYYGNTYYIGSEFGEELAEFYLKDFADVHVEITSDKQLAIHWRNANFPSVADIIEKAGFPIQFKLFRDYGQQ